MTTGAGAGSSGQPGPESAGVPGDTPGRESYQLLTWGCGQPYCPYQSAA